MALDRSCRNHCVGAALLVLLTLAVCWATDAADEKFVDGLLQRQLFQLAELHCQQQLTRADLDDERRGALVIQLLKAYTQHAINVPRAERQALWNQTSSTWSDFRKSVGNQRLWPNVALHYRLAEITRGETLRLEAEVSADREADLAEATRVLRQSVRALQDLEENVRQLQRHPTGDDSKWSQRELTELLNHIRITVAQTLLQQSACYRSGSPDNVHLLSQARDSFAALARLTGNSELTQLSQLGQIECHRRLRDFAAASEKQQRLAANPSLSLPVRWKLINESAQLKIDQDSPREAMDLLQRQLAKADRPTDPNIVAQTELALIRAYVAAWKAAAKSSGADQEQWRAAAITQLQNMERNQPKYWVRRAEILLSSIQSQSTDFADVEILSRSAAHHFRRQKYAEAISTYRRAAKLARELNDPHLAFDLDYQAAAILLHMKDYARARDAFQQVAFGYPSHINAARAHRIAITCAARLAANSADELRRYETMLSDQIRHWPDACNQARLWLAKLQQQQGKWMAANDTLIVVDDSFPQISEVRQRIRLGFEKLLADHPFGSDERNRLASKAADYFEHAAKNADQPQQWDPGRREAAVDAATFRLLHTLDDPAAVTSLLEAAISSDDSEDLWSLRARALSGLAHLLLGDPSRSHQRLAGIDWSQIDNGLDFLRRLERDIHASGKIRARELAALMLTISRGVAADDEKQQQQLAQYQADALDLLGKRPEALTIYQRLVKQTPGDARLQYRCAQLWEQGNTPHDQQLAMDHWRHTVRLSESASPLWFEAKLGIARLHLALGDAKRAADVIHLTEVLHPDLGGEKMKERFKELSSSIDNNSAQIR